MRNCLVTLALAVLTACGAEGSRATQPPAPPRVPTIQLSVRPETAVIGDTVRWTVIVHDSLGQIVENPKFSVKFIGPNDLIHWYDGYATAILPLDVRSTILEVSYQSAVARKTIVVVPDVGTVRLNPASRMRIAGTGESLSVRAWSSPKWYAPLNDFVTHWSSSDTSVATVVDGKVVAKRLGQTQITASVGLVRDSMPLTVVAPYRIVEIPQSPDAGPTRFTDRGDVLAYSLDHYLVWLFADRATYALNGCPTAYDMNENGDVLCGSGGQLNVWNRGSVEPVVGLLDDLSCLSAGLNTRREIAYVTSSNCGWSGARTKITIWSPDGSTEQLSSFPGTPYRVLFFDDARNLGLGALDGGYVHRDGSNAWDGATSFGVSAANAQGYMVGMRGERGGDLGMIRAPGGQPQPAGQGPFHGINNANQVVGYSNVSASGVLGTASEPFMARLNDLVLGAEWNLIDGLAINNRGMILAKGVSRVDGHNALIILIPST